MSEKNSLFFQNNRKFSSLSNHQIRQYFLFSSHPKIYSVGNNKRVYIPNDDNGVGFKLAAVVFICSTERIRAVLESFFLLLMVAS